MSLLNWLPAKWFGRTPRQASTASTPAETIRSVIEQVPLEDQRLWLKNTLDILPKPFFLLDFEKNRVSFTNAAARRMMGLEYANHHAREIYGTHFSVSDVNGTLIAAENLPTARILRGEKVEGEEFVLTSAAGIFNIKVFSEVIPSQYGQPASALIIFQDITALKKTEADLRFAQMNLKDAVEIAQVGFWSLDAETQKISINEQLMQQFDIEPSTFNNTLGEAVDKIHPDDREKVTLAIEKSVAEKSPYHIEYRVVRRDSSIRWIEAKSGATGLLQKDQMRLTGTTVDITDRVKSRQVLEAAERDLRLLADSMPQIVWSANPDGLLDYFNQVWFDYSGSDFEANVGQGWVQFVHPDDLPLTAARWAESIQNKKTYENEFRLRAKDGAYRWHVARARPIFNEVNEVKKWYGTNTDIHDQKLLTENLNDARNAAERANSAKSQFLANMSHEIRTPLGAIMGFSELIKENGLGRIEREEFVSVIERNSTQLMRIIDDILDLSKVEAGMMLIEKIDFSLLEALTDFSSLMGFKAREKGIRFSAKAVTSLPSSINCDPTRLRQILMNVVGNAIKFTDEGHVELRVSFHDGWLECEVEDTGRGISAAQAEILFQPFTQADATTTRKYGGTGLGLVLTRSLAEALGGEFNLLKSELGRGSTFVVRIRAGHSPDAKFLTGLGFESAPARTMTQFGQLAGLRTLLVEDSPDNQALISIYLGRAGARVDIASDGEQGYKMARSADYDVVLMDVQMPIMDGITAVKKLRAEGYARPIIALTAHAMKEERIRCLDAGFTDFLSKPVNREELTRILATFKAAT